MLYFFGWWAVFIALLLYWIVERGETSGYIALAWAGFGIWRIWNASEEAKAERMEEWRQQFRPGTITEDQIRYIEILCRDEEKELPPNLSEMSEAQAKGIISELTGKFVEL